MNRNGRAVQKRYVSGRDWRAAAKFSASDWGNYAGEGTVAALYGTIRMLKLRARFLLTDEVHHLFEVTTQEIEMETKT